MKVRTVAAAGFASVALLVPVTALLLATAYPFADALPTDVVAYFNRHRPPFMSAILVEFVSLAFITVFVAGIFSLTSDRTAGVTLGAGMLMVLLIGLEIATIAAVAFQPSAEAATALWPLAHFGIGVLLHVITALFVAAASLGLSTGGDAFLSEPAPKRLVLITGSIAVIGNASVPFAYFGRSVDFAAGVIEHVLATLPYVVWVLAVCVTIVTTGRQADVDAV